MEMEAKNGNLKHGKKWDWKWHDLHQFCKQW